VVVKPSPLWIDGSATFTIETSRMTMNWARQTTNSRADLDAERPGLDALAVGLGMAGDMLSVALM
jgi:hypothetical protein